MTIISRLNTTLYWVKNLKFLDCFWLKKIPGLAEMFWNILDEKEILDNKKFDFTYTVVAILD